MTPAQIAASLTPAQVRALHLKHAGWAADCKWREWIDLHFKRLIVLDWITPAGRAVLAELDRAETEARETPAGKVIVRRTIIEEVELPRPPTE